MIENAPLLLTVFSLKIFIALMLVASSYITVHLPVENVMHYYGFGQTLLCPFLQSMRSIVRRV
jgi:hypothetical protein